MCFDQHPPGVWVFSPHPDLAPSRNPVTHVLKRWPWGSRMQIGPYEPLVNCASKDTGHGKKVISFLSDCKMKMFIFQLTYTINHKFHVLPPNISPPVLIPTNFDWHHPSTCPPKALSLLRLIPDGSLKERMLQSLKIHPTKAICNNSN